MNKRILKRASVLLTAGAALLALGGCYTVLLTSGTSGTTASGETSYSSAGGPDIQYTSDCRSCHSDAELADRAYDVSMAGLHVVHGMAVDPYGWNYHYRPQPWWVPAVVQTGSAVANNTPAVTTGTATRTRTEGDSRGGTVNAVVPTSNQTATPPAPPTAAPASGARTTGAEAPAPRTRTEGKTGGSRARTDGSTRGDRK